MRTTIIGYYLCVAFKINEMKKRNENETMGSRVTSGRDGGSTSAPTNDRGSSATQTAEQDAALSVVRLGSGIQRVERARQLLAETRKLDGSMLGSRELCCYKPGLREFGGFRLKSMEIDGSRLRRRELC